MRELTSDNVHEQESSCCSDTGKDNNNSSCCSSEANTIKVFAGSCCGPLVNTLEIPHLETDAKVTIDGQEIRVTGDDKNIVDVADRAKIGIPAPCYRTNRQNGCCQACLVEINGEQKYACTTLPENGMSIIINRADLKAIRKQRLLEYREGKKSSAPCECSTSGSNNCCS